MTPAVGDVVAQLRTRRYLTLLVVAAVLGVPIAAAAYWYLYLVNDLQKWLFQPDYLLKSLGFHGEPIWWPIPMVTLAGILVGLTIQYLPGRGGHSPADGFQAGGAPPPIQLPGVILASLAGLALGAVIGPEAPLIAIGGGLAAGAVRLAKRDLPQQSIQIVGAAGGFAAVSTLLGSPLSGAFLLMEASGFGGPILGLILVPGLLAAGVGSLIFIGFDAWTGHGVVSLTVPNLPHFSRPDGAQFGWAIAIGLAAAVLGGCIRWLGLFLKPHVERRIAVLAPVVGLTVGALAVLFAEASGKSSSLVLFSGQTALPTFLENTAAYSVGTLILLLLCKGLAYGASLSAFRGGPTFPGMFLGAVGGVAFSHLPGLPMVAGAAMGVGAMTCAILGLPLTSVLLTTIFFGSDGVAAMPVVIVAVVVAYVGRAHLSPRPRPESVERASDPPSSESSVGTPAPAAG
jgi:chloride channel protein, CIC family